MNTLQQFLTTLAARYEAVREMEDKGKPSCELPWYSAYNAVKDSRGTEFKKATLLHAFQSVSACVIMIYAQYGMTLRLPFFVRRLHFLEIMKLLSGHRLMSISIPMPTLTSGSL